MSNTVLATKWRPKLFSDLIGQDPVVTALENSLDNQRLHHSYLFTGTRGVGKTTLARILAKCLNCETNNISSSLKKLLSLPITSDIDSDLLNLYNDMDNGYIDILRVNIEEIIDKCYV